MTEHVAPLPPELLAVAPDYFVEDPKDAPPLRWGIMGSGGIAAVFAETIPAYSSGTITAVGSRTQESADAFAAAHGIPFAYGSYEELAASAEVDAIYVATPHIRHKDDALLALRAGKPVLVEKPFTMTQAEAEEVFAEAKERGLFVMEAMWSRHLPHYRFIKAAIESGAGGQITAITADHGQWLKHIPRLMEPGLGGGALLDLGIYPVHFLHHALGLPEEVVAWGLPTGTGVDAAEVIIARYPGALGSASSSLQGFNATPGIITFEQMAIEMPEQFYRPTTVNLRTFPERAAGKDTQEVTSWDARVPGGFQYQAAEAARRIAAGDLESPVVSWNDTVEVMGLMDEIHQQLEADGAR